LSFGSPVSGHSGVIEVPDATAIVREREENEMLVLSRQLDESIMIGDDIVITVVDIRGDKVRLGIAAPTTIPVHRQEVYEMIQRENMQAAFVEAQTSQPAATATAKPAVFRPKRPV
jgi:carbon storage regulator